MVVSAEMVCSFQVFRPGWHKNRSVVSPADVAIELVDNTENLKTL